MAEPPPAAVPKPCCVCDAPNGKHCTKCKSRHYCGKKCQLVDWNEGGHKAQCRQLAAAFQDRMLDAIMPAKLKIKEEPAIVEDVLLADGSKAAARLSAVRLEKTAVKAAALNGDTPDWRGTCAICLDVLPVGDDRQTLYSCCCKRICRDCSAKCQQHDMRCPLCRAPAPKSVAVFLRQLQTHADKGNAEAQVQLGKWYHVGSRGLKQNIKRAVQLYELAAAQGHALAQYALGYCYEVGEGVAQSYDEAVKWFRLAAAQGDAYALCNLAVCYANGQGVPRDLHEALRLFKRAAAKGGAGAAAKFERLEAHLAAARPGPPT